MASAPSASFFSLPLPPWAQPPSTRVAQYERQKRKSHEWSDEDEDGAETTDAPSAVESIPAGDSLILTPNESHQYRIAGLPLNQELPGGHFPHGPAKDDRPSKENMPAHLRKGLSSLSPPIYPPQSPAQQGNIRFQHLAVLTAILHRCLLQGDYIRAGRAWGLLLREEFRGLPMDVRSEGRWGIGAEILLRRSQRDTPTHSQRTSSDSENTPLPFSKKGFVEAKEYYERLILNHPGARSSPDAISPLHFYPAIFGLWIYVAQEESSATRNDITLNHENSDGFSDDDDSMSDSGHRRGSPNKKQTLIAAARAQELEQAQQIAARMDAILPSPPYSDSSELLELRGMVSLWIGDLFVSSLATQPETSDVYDPGAMVTDELPSSFEVRREHRIATEKRMAEVQKSIDFFEKAKKRGRSVAYNLEHLHIDDTSFD
ncbi:Transcription initiation factor Rrn11 [Penicillium alfredii]|uniref:Transcription initiation factor Rrn11 n=1 Tax=Penicillium alfredii TaxID=1506179 RepID=A0A9W9EH56_9EURO|nr:Transcription initiation factor Rrn11 [Penicillium alfredii]KAJ5081684.1 Transcription initiation factor Rrn11 [Penicillium alfredii]